ncbi:NAD-dependent epimerase/dehydratase family protein [Spirochaetota bacterium]
MQKRTALLIGASGLVGSHCLQQLLADDDYEKVIILSRRELSVTHTKLEQHIFDFSTLREHKDVIKAYDIYCCLGTTVKKAKTKKAYWNVDVAYPIETGKIALENGASQYLIVTAMGADKRSLIPYNRTKGVVEAGIRALQYKAIHIFRPSFITGDRQEYRMLEEGAKKVMKVIGFAFIGPFKRFKPNHAGDIAKAMIRAAKSGEAGVHVHTAKEMH